MEDETQNHKKDYLLPISILISAVIIAGAWVYTTGLEVSGTAPKAGVSPANKESALGGKLFPSRGVVLPVRWGDLGVKLVSAGVVDDKKFKSLYAVNGELPEENRKLLEGIRDERIKINRANAGFLLNLFWALGLGNKNDILETGPMSNPRYGNAGNFASTGGWTLAVGNAMNHYSAHSFVPLTAEEQALVEKAAKNIYRPCCDNSAYFPDCNHGMAMLGLLELMASQGVSEEEMYRTALAVNGYWFPDNYLTIARYLELKGVSWDKADPKDILGYGFSAYSGYSRLLTEINPPQQKGGSSCGV